MRSEHWQERLAFFKKDLSSAPEQGILFLGDSITEEFPINKYFKNYPIINRGISGDSIDGVIERLDISALKLKPQKIFLMIGVNDISNGLSVSKIEANYRALLSLLETELPNSDLLIQSILPCTATWGKPMVDQIQEINKFLKRTCRKKNNTYINLYDHFIESNRYLQEELTSDGLHLNVDGYDLWAKTINPFLS